MKQLLLDLITEGNPKSSRRVLTLLIAAVFVFTVSTVPFLLIGLFIYSYQLQGINIEALKSIIGLLENILKYEVLILALGLFFTTMKSRLQALKIFGENLFRSKRKGHGFNSGYYGRVDEYPNEPPHDPINDKPL